MNHPPFITIFMGGIFNHQFDGWCTALLYPHYFLSGSFTSLSWSYVPSLPQHAPQGCSLPKTAIRGRFIDMLVPCSAVNLSKFNKFRPGYLGYLGISWKILVALPEPQRSPAAKSLGIPSGSQRLNGHLQVLAEQMKVDHLWCLWWLNPTPLKNMTSSVGMMTFPTEWKI